MFVHLSLLQNMMKQGLVVIIRDGVSRLGLGPLFLSLGLECFRSRLGLERCRSRSRAL